MKIETSVLDPVEGDIKTVFDTDNEEEVKLAKAQFKEMREKKGYAAYTVDKKGEKKAVATCWEDVEEAGAVIYAPRPVGG